MTGDAGVRGAGRGGGDRHRARHAAERSGCGRRVLRFLWAAVVVVAGRAVVEEGVRRLFDVLGIG